MESPLDYTKKFGCWAQDKWAGTFMIKWTFIKDIPNAQFRHILLSNNEGKPVTNSRDTQEVLLEPGAHPPRPPHLPLLPLLVLLPAPSCFRRQGAAADIPRLPLAHLDPRRLWLLRQEARAHGGEGAARGAGARAAVGAAADAVRDAAAASYAAVRDAAGRAPAAAAAAARRAAVRAAAAAAARLRAVSAADSAAG